MFETTEEDGTRKADPISVLIVEDHPITSEGLARGLADEQGIHLLGQASSLAAGLNMIASNQPHVILLDLHLPDSPGAQRTVQAVSGAAPQSKILILSAEARGTTTSTVRKQCNLLELRLGLSNREELIAWAAKNGFADVD